MPSDCLTFAQGQTATLTAQFVTTPAGMPINVPDATIEIFGPSGSVVLGPTPMALVVTGLYYYDYVIPNSLAVNTYTVRFSGTILGTPTANSLYLQVIAAGSPYGAPSQSQAAAVAALERYIRCAQHIPVEAELARISYDRTEAQLQWPRWNLTNPIIRRNDRIIESGFAIDFDIGKITFGSSLHETDKVDASYIFRWFSQEELVGFLNDAMNRINIEAPGTEYTLDNMPSQLMGVLLHGAASQAIQAMMMCLQFQKPKTVFGGADEAAKAFGNLNTLKENHEKMFNEDRRKFKIARYPRIAAVSAPEFSLPGGRCLSPITSITVMVCNMVLNMEIREVFLLQQLGIPLWVMSRNENETIFAPISKIWRTEKKPAYELLTKRGKMVIASKEHLFFANDHYVPLSSLRTGDHLTSLNGHRPVDDRVVSVSKVGSTMMYDMEVPSTGNFFADGIQCHNSRWFRYLYSSNMS